MIGRLQSRPGVPAPGQPPVGLLPLGPEGERDALLYVPTTYRAETPLPLVLMLHGAGGTARGGIEPLLGSAEAANLILVSPRSRGRTWDAVGGLEGRDVPFVDAILAETMGRYAIDPAQVAVAGFSDGASYALTLGLANGDLFRAIIGFSPGFRAGRQPRGRPRVFVSHGVSDDILPIDRCSRRIVPALKDEGYDVRYEEFAGGHEIPPAIVAAALTWLETGA